jgi:hypothetical protein
MKLGPPTSPGSAWAPAVHDSALQPRWDDAVAQAQPAASTSAPAPASTSALEPAPAPLLPADGWLAALVAPPRAPAWPPAPGPGAAASAPATAPATGSATQQQLQCALRSEGLVSQAGAGGLGMGLAPGLEAVRQVVPASISSAPAPVSVLARLAEPSQWSVQLPGRLAVEPALHLQLLHHPPATGLNPARPAEAWQVQLAAGTQRPEAWALRLPQLQSRLARKGRGDDAPAQPALPATRRPR